jgi:3-dehydroquinate synthase
VDSVLINFYPKLFGPKTVQIQFAETDKTLESVAQILNILYSRNIKRDSIVTFIGGGVLQDLATLATSIYMRGIRWTYVPTTLQSMLDSCIGGKSSINLGPAKNLIGNFYPPHEIHIWPGFLQTLDNQHIICGLIEGLKISAASDDVRLNHFFQLTNNLASIRFTSQEFEEIVFHTLSIKKHFVENDEFDLGMRKLLNFGHTFGHAIESAADYLIPHGIAVGVGILAAYNLARFERFFADGTSEVELATLRLLLNINDDTQLHIRNLDLDQVLTCLGNDKKAHVNSYTFILPNTDGSLQIQKFDVSTQNNWQIKQSLKLALDRVTNG